MFSIGFNNVRILKKLEVVEKVVISWHQQDDLLVPTKTGRQPTAALRLASARRLADAKNNELTSKLVFTSALQFLSSLQQQFQTFDFLFVLFKR